MKENPKKYMELLDKMEHRFPQDAEIFGKPNIMVNPLQLENGSYVNVALNSFTTDEIIDLAEKYCGDLKSFAQASFPFMKRVFEKIEKENNENEYNRTEIQKGVLNQYLINTRKNKFDLNQSNGIRLIERTDCSSKKTSYVN